MEIKIVRPGKLKRWRLKLDDKWMGKHMQAAALFVELMRFFSLGLSDKKARIGVWSGGIAENETLPSNDIKYLGFALLSFLEDDVAVPDDIKDYEDENIKNY